MTRRRSTAAPGLPGAALTNGDEAVLRAAKRAIDRAHREPHHTVGSAVRTTSGKIFRGVNVETVGYGPCAEPVAIGAAAAAGGGAIRVIVAVGRPPDHRILPPCGNCRQLLISHAPGAWVILSVNGGPRKVRAADLLPRPYRGSRSS